MNSYRKTIGCPVVGLRGLDPGLDLFMPTSKTLTNGPFGNNLHSAGYSLTQRNIGGC